MVESKRCEAQFQANPNRLKTPEIGRCWYFQHRQFRCLRFNEQFRIQFGRSTQICKWPSESLKIRHWKTMINRWDLRPMSTADFLQCTIIMSSCLWILWSQMLKRYILYPWKMVVGRLFSYWEGNFSGDILNFSGVHLRPWNQGDNVEQV